MRQAMVRFPQPREPGTSKTPAPAQSVYAGLTRVDLLTDSIDLLTIAADHRSLTPSSKPCIMALGPAGSAPGSGPERDWRRLTQGWIQGKSEW